MSMMQNMFDTPLDQLPPPVMHSRMDTPGPGNAPDYQQLMSEAQAHLPPPPGGNGGGMGGGGGGGGGGMGMPPMGMGMQSPGAMGMQGMQGMQAPQQMGGGMGMQGMQAPQQMGMQGMQGMQQGMPPPEQQQMMGGGMMMMGGGAPTPQDYFPPAPPPPRYAPSRRRHTAAAPRRGAWGALEQHRGSLVVAAAVYLVLVYAMPRLQAWAPGALAARVRFAAVAAALSAASVAGVRHFAPAGARAWVA